MYKDDNITGGCSEALLHKILYGEKSSCSTCESTADKCPYPQKVGGNGKTWGLAGYPLASVYAPLQSFDNLYDMNTALKQGTVFSELDLPFLGNKRVGKGGSSRG